MRRKEELKVIQAHNMRKRRKKLEELRKLKVSY